MKATLKTPAAVQPVLLAALILAADGFPPASAQEAKRPVSEKLGKRSLERAQKLSQRAADLYKAKRYQDAASLAREALRLREDSLGPGHADVALSLYLLGTIELARGESKAALPLLERALAINEKVLGPDHPSTGATLINLATVHQAVGDRKAAIPLLQRALAIEETIQGRDHPSLVSPLEKLAGLHLAEADYEAALALLERVLKLKEAAPGKDERSIAVTLNNLGMVHQDLGNYPQARGFLERSIRIKETVLGRKAPGTATSVSNLAFVHQELGNYETAFSLQSRALKIRVEVLGPNDRSVATSLEGLAGLRRLMGDNQGALPLHERALAIREKALGADHPKTAISVANLASLHWATGNFPAALPLYRRALTVTETFNGPDHPSTAGVLNNLAFLQRALGQNEAARESFERALKIREAAFGPNHRLTGDSLNNLALLHSALGDDEAAGRLHERALAIAEALFGPTHPDTAGSLKNLAYVRKGLGDDASALELVERASAAECENLRRALNYFTEAESLTYALDHSFYDLPGFLESGALAARAQLQTKGLVMEAIGFRRQLEARLAREPDGLALLEERGRLAARYQKLAIEEGETTEASRALRQRMDDLVRRINERLSAGNEFEKGGGDSFQLVPSPVELTEVREVLPEGVRLLQGFRYRHKMEADQGFEQRYAWTVTGPPSAGEPVFVELGFAQAIDDAIAAFRAFFEDDEGRGIRVETSEREVTDPEDGVREAAEKLYRLLWQPLEDTGALGDEVTTVVLSLDSQLHFLPFGALIHPAMGGSKAAPSRFLCQDYSIRYVNSARDLVAEPPAHRDGPRHALLVGNPAYDQGKSDPGSGKRPARILAAVDPERIGRNLQRGMADDSRGLLFAPLPGAEIEATRLGDKLEASGYKVRRLISSAATERALRAAVQRPSLLHLATHGFFLAQSEREETPSGSSTSFASMLPERRPLNRARMQDPMLRSGLALTGANRTMEGWHAGMSPKDTGDDGLLLAAEAATLDLRGTKLIVMSACSTAEGKAMDGEGVMGLRRALAVAGAETVIMTLWPVDDKVTVELMERFYARYLDGMHPARALDETRREILIDRSKTEGLGRAIWRYAPFIATSMGPVVPGDPTKSGPPANP